MTDRLTELLDADGPGLHALLLRLTRDRDAAADLFQDLFARLAADGGGDRDGGRVGSVGGGGGFARAADPAAFAYRVAINLAHDWRRRRKVRAAVTLPADLPAAGTALVADAAPGGDPDPLFAAADRDDLTRVFDAIARLNPIARDAVCLRYLRQRSYAEVGRAIGRTAHQARAACHAAVRQVRRALNAEGGR